MDPKYYTPTIDEFCIGFEYQEHTDPRHDEGWTDQKIEDVDGLIRFLQLHRKDSDADLRVKFLDQADIESLGWTLIKKDLYQIDGGYQKLELIDANHNLKIWYAKIHSIILTQDDIGLVFQGNVKNKSELKRLMTQLNIHNRE